MLQVLFIGLSNFRKTLFPLLGCAIVAKEGLMADISTIFLAVSMLGQTSSLPITAVLPGLSGLQSIATSSEWLQS